MEQCRRYEGLVSQCRNVNGTSDLAHLARSWPAPQGRAPIMKRLFVPPQPPPPPETEEDGPSMPINENIPPPLKDELVIDRLSAVQVKPSHDALRKQAIELDAQIRQIQDALDTTVRLQQRSLEASLFNKANEIQEDISMKRFDLRVAQIHLSAINSQKELFSNKLDNSGDSGRERKMSNASQGSMKTKWLKAFKSLKTPPPETEKKNQMYHAVSTIIQMRKNGSAATRELLKGDPDAHNFQEYTYKKITPCDICSQVLRGHTRQGLKCRICKMNVHVDCQEKASKCQAKARLLRRQKSTSEIETRIPDSTVEDETPHSPRRQKLNLRMKSLSLDSPESTEHVQRRKHHGAAATSDPHSNQSSSSRIQFSVPVRPIHSNLVARSSHKANSTPSSPVHNRRLLSAKNIRMSSVELPDDNEKSPSSASTSPCPSPVGGKKPHRLLPTNLYVVLYNFKSRHQDELDLKAGYKVTVIDTSDPDWWKGKCLGRVGYFPSKYCSKLSPGEKPLQVTHNLQVSDGDNGLMLLRDQIVIQIGEELDGMVMIRSGDNRQGVCPVKFLQEV
ncbi:PREDICTED: SH3 and cysteine-rich domain-containing protein 3-like isoform X10 [Nicrophorus vespilloides]|uniref:SH3 and cysteine-rich domain-containing protein 3-like isoform X10 n=1 Tax=Nicrophorus vespilloides TaxID=110193 RepID=A0ABM1M2S5_NICVS|nr:PREDICTED: SH3 and cysteine-rich domain-containing protein 3-like isoform X10 [Nicrophorus vespilloides]